ncbi:MAG: hypothetical protein D3926_04455 [Desulfobacteraceae bacterium]|nr:MAG: hypothetical protein D3926_04455 [Desulfobacteraceae bacterium]
MRIKHLFVLVAIVVSSLLIPGNLSECIAIDSSCVIYLPFTGNANDESGNEHHGVVTGAALAADRHGNSNSAYYFDGSSYITVEAGDSILNVDTAGFTLSFWVKPDEHQDERAAPLISYGYGSSGGYGIAYWQQYGMFRTSFYDYSWTGIYVAVDELDDHIWYMYTITYDGHLLKEYVNGVFINQSAGPYHPALPTGTYKLRIGADSRYTNQFFKGYIDDIQMYKRVFTDLEIAHLSGLSGAIRATQLNAYSLTDFELGILKPAKFSNFWAVWGNHGNAYTEIVENPVKSGFNTSDFVGVSHTFPSLGLPNTTDCDKSEYVLTSADGLVTDQHHIMKWKLLIPDASILNIESIVWNWMSFNQIHTGASKYPPPGVPGDPDPSIAYGGGIFNDLVKSGSHPDDSSMYNFRVRAVPDEALIPFQIDIGTWMSFTYEVFWTKSRTGFWRLWKNGELLASADDVKTLPDSYNPEEDDFLHFKTGLYNKWHDPDIERISLYFDDMELYIGNDIRVVDVCPECQGTGRIEPLIPIINYLLGWR